MTETITLELDDLTGTGTEFRERVMAEVGEGASFERSNLPGGQETAPTNEFQSSLERAGMPLNFEGDIGNAILTQ